MYTRIALKALKVSYSDIGEGRNAVNCEKTQFFLNTLYLPLYIRRKSAGKKAVPGFCPLKSILKYLESSRRQNTIIDSAFPIKSGPRFWSWIRQVEKVDSEHVFCFHNFNFIFFRG